MEGLTLVFVYVELYELCIIVIVQVAEHLVSNIF